MKLVLYFISILLISTFGGYLGFLEGQKRYEVNLFIPNQAQVEHLKQNEKGYDACVRLRGGINPVCNCEVIDRGKE